MKTQGVAEDESFRSHYVTQHSMETSPPPPGGTPPPPPPSTTTSGSPTDFLKGVVGKNVIVRLTSGVDYRGSFLGAWCSISKKC